MTLTNGEMSPPLWREWRIVLVLLALSILYNAPFYLPFFSAEARQPGVFVTGHNWDLHYFYHAVVYRSVVDFREWPFWNPWNLGGSSMWGNPQTPFPTPMFLVTLVFGLLNGVRLQVLLHHFVGLLGMFWMARRLGLTRPAAVLAASIFMLSTWYSLHLAVGHTNFWPAAYMPWALGCLHAAARRMTWVVGAAAWLALIVFEGGHHIFMIFFVMAGFLALGWAIQRRSWRPLLALVLIVVFSGGFSAVRLAPEMALLARNPRPTIPGGQTYETCGRIWNRSPPTLCAAAPRRSPCPPKKWQLPQSMPRHQRRCPPSRRWPGPVSRRLPANWPRSFWDASRNRRSFTSATRGTAGTNTARISGRSRCCCSPVLCSGCGGTGRGSWRPRYVFSFRRGISWRIPRGLLHKLPIYEQSRVPSRYLIPTVLCLAMVAAVVFDELWRRAAARKPRRVALTVLVALAIADLTWVGGERSATRRNMS